MRKWLSRRTKNEIILIILFTLSFFAFVDGIVLTYKHYVSTPDGFCDIFSKKGCDIVDQSPYSTVDNIFYFLSVNMKIAVPVITISIPIAIMAIVVFLLIKIGILHIWHGKSLGRFNPEHMLLFIRVILSFSLLYGLWLFYIQGNILHSYCIYCIILDALIFLSLITSFFVKVERKS